MMDRKLMLAWGLGVLVIARVVIYPIIGHLLVSVEHYYESERLLSLNYHKIREAPLAMYQSPTLSDDLLERYETLPSGVIRFSLDDCERELVALSRQIGAYSFRIVGIEASPPVCSVSLIKIGERALVP